MQFEKTARYFVLGIIATIPLVFGAVHPLLTGVYTFLLLVGLGGWLLLNPTEKKTSPSLNILLPLIIILWIALQSLPLPIEIVEFLSPHRAERVSMVNTLTGTIQKFVTLSENGREGLYKALFLLSFLLYYQTLKRLFAQDKNFLNTVVLAIVAVGTLEAFYGLFQFVSPQVGILWLAIKGRAAYGTIIYKNQYASFLNMIWPLAIASGLYFFLNQKKRIQNKKTENQITATLKELANTKIQAIIYLFAAALMWLAVLFSLSRGGILAMVLVAMCFIFFLPFSKMRKLTCLMAFVVFVGSYGAILGLDTVVARFNSMGSSGAVRFDIYLASLPLLMDHWLTGIGVGAYTLLSPVYLKGFPVNIHFDRVHNEYLELFIELGIPMASLLFLWLAFQLGRMLRNIIDTTRLLQLDLNLFLPGLASFCGLLGFLIHGVVDFGWRLPANLLYATTLAAIATYCLENGMRQPKGKKGENKAT
ncbi:O-antigen ligase [Desulforhopalus sp. IMCC35007]|uniref:O-antigen ligase family protein n=1 Tax=Desulforhopalus sp. IMCC35007 TaxID=2569543 RepID=UPI0010AE5473|nr:O-antigen ligase family protein [Desulforhopalus sp. IMCC35007]TKB09908.1 O-antigen ligase family protein [Desulforhopalus sp. IMCC35007]